MLNFEFILPVGRNKWQTYISSKLLEAEICVSFEPGGDIRILPTALVFQNLREIPMVERDLPNKKEFPNTTDFNKTKMSFTIGLIPAALRAAIRFL